MYLERLNFNCNLFRLTNDLLGRMQHDITLWVLVNWKPFNILNDKTLTTMNDNTDSDRDSYKLLAPRVRCLAYETAIFRVAV